MIIKYNVGLIMKVIQLKNRLQNDFIHREIFTHSIFS